MLYKINHPQVAHETIDGETFVINTSNGLYYVASGYAESIWNAIANNFSFAQIKNAVEKSDLFDDKDNALDSYFSLLVSEGLIVKTDNDQMENPNQLHIDKNINFPAPTLTKYDDLQELMALDPIHEISEQQGWPFQK